MARRRHRAAHSGEKHAGPTRGRHAALEGVVRIVRRDLATVETPEGHYLVAHGGLNGGMGGDVARVELVRRGRGEPKAIVRSVITRATQRFVGTFGVVGPLGAVVPLDERIPHDFFVLPADESPARLGVAAGDVVVARILTYPSRREGGVVTLERRIGPSDKLDLPIERVIASHGLAVAFPDPVGAQAHGIRADVGSVLAAQPQREDLRSWTCVTIDPADARDFDDAVSCTRTSDGGFSLGVHIADVTHYVPWNSSIDLEARSRTCSAYLVDRVVPMLPEQLSNDVCSLRPGRDRLAMSVCAELSPTGKVLSARACTSAIRSSARLAYDEVDEVLAKSRNADALACEPGIDPRCVASMLRDLAALARLRERVRHERGAIDFESEEPKVILAADGHPTGVRVRRKTPATSLIEEAMLVANEAVAGMLAVHDELPCAFRVHEPPSPDTLVSTIPALRELGVLRAGDAERLHAGDPFAIQDVIDRSKGSDAEFLASTLLLRAMKRAVYLPVNEGHYALGAPAYCHFTSPIRRYPDMTVHRALKRLLGAPIPACADGNPASSAAVPIPTMGEHDWHEVSASMPQLCRTCSEKEREADAAARDSQKVKMSELYMGRVGESFSGIVVGCERFGLFVRLDDTRAEGLVPIRALGEEWFAYDEKALSLTGEASGKSWHLGQRVAVTVSGCTPERGQIDFVPAAGAKPAAGATHESRREST